MTVAQVDLDTLHALVTHEPLAVAGKQFGDAGSERVKSILRFLKQCARHATVHEKSDVTVFALMQPDALVAQRRLEQATAFQPGITAKGSIHQLVVEVREDGSPFVWAAIPGDIGAIVQTGIVYRLAQGVETFSINGAAIAVPKVILGAVSQFILELFHGVERCIERLSEFDGSYLQVSPTPRCLGGGKPTLVPDETWNIACARHSITTSLLLPPPR